MLQLPPPEQPEQAQFPPSLSQKLQVYIDEATDRCSVRGAYASHRAQLVQDYQQKRLAYDKDLLSRDADNIALFQGVVLVGANLEPAEQEILQSKHDYRQKIVDHLLTRRADIERKLRQHFIVAGHLEVTSGQIVDAIIEDLSSNAFCGLSASSRFSLLAQLKSIPDIQDKSQLCSAIFKHCQVFPHLDTINIDLHNKSALELFFGHLIATFTGSGKHLYLNSQPQIELITKQLQPLANREISFPTFAFFGHLAEPMRIFLLQECLRAQIESPAAATILTARRESPDQPSLAAQMLDYYDNFGKPEESQNILKKFKSQPTNYAVMDKARAFWGHPTRRSILDDLRRTLPGQLPLAEIYQTIQNIHQIRTSTDANYQQQHAGDLATIFLLDLERILCTYNKEPQKEEGSPDQSGQALHLLVHQVRELAQITTLAVRNYA